MNDYDIKNIGLMLRNSRDFTWFTCHLMRLIAKSDEVNREKIRLAYPEEVSSFERWKRGELQYVS